MSTTLNTADTNDSTVEQLIDQVADLLEDTADRAIENDRKTVQPRDL